MVLGMKTDVTTRQHWSRYVDVIGAICPFCLPSVNYVRRTCTFPVISATRFVVLFWTYRGACFCCTALDVPAGITQDGAFYGFRIFLSSRPTFLRQSNLLLFYREKGPAAHIPRRRRSRRLCVFTSLSRRFFLSTTSLLTFHPHRDYSITHDIAARWFRGLPPNHGGDRFPLSKRGAPGFPHPCSSWRECSCLCVLFFRNCEPRARQGEQLCSNRGYVYVPSPILMLSQNIYIDGWYIFWGVSWLLGCW